MLLPRNLTGWAKELVNLVGPCMMSDNLLATLIPLRVNVYVLWLTSLIYSILISKYHKPRVTKLVYQLFTKTQKPNVDLERIRCLKNYIFLLTLILKDSAETKPKHNSFSF